MEVSYLSYLVEGDRVDAYIYVKSDTNISCFDKVIEKLKSNLSTINVTVENRRAFREYNKLVNSLPVNDFIVINDIKDIGSNNMDVANRLEWLIQNDKMLVINNVSSTYEYGVSQPMNKAVLGTLLQAILLNNSNVIEMKKKVSVGRNRIEFPDNWDELYSKWESKEISSKEFIEQSGLKKATFYNLITEYKRIQEFNDEYFKKYQRA